MNLTQMLRPMFMDKVMRIFFFNLEEIKAKVNIIMLPVLTKLLLRHRRETGLGYLHRSSSPVSFCTQQCVYA